ncbi:hypothetical protein N0V90_006161 [Kalmusia sp. IMI 367209]|nr:hypothetical protein N0V90_006161 [Kalmusia sp. IMI 367209]
MANLQFPSNPTTYRRTGWQLVLMLLMGINYLIDHEPRHVQYKKERLGARKAEKHRHKSGFVTELPDDFDEDEHCDGDMYDTPLPVHAFRSLPATHPVHPPPVSRDGKEAWPYASRYARRGSYEARNGRQEWERQETRLASREQMRDAWMRMRSVTRLPYEYVKRADRRKKRVAFDRDVQWHFFDDGSYDGSGEGEDRGIRVRGCVLEQDKHVIHEA